MKVKIDHGDVPGTYKVMPPYGFIVLIKGKKAVLQLADDFGLETEDLDAAIQYLDSKCGYFQEFADTIKVDGKKKRFPWNPKSAEAEQIPKTKEK